ncbi:MAG: hypothetical protein KAT53_05000 [Dehalococcoidia bacterium]|nr:hypothetical protein [Dehalococcoidia bacterium]
MSFPSISTGVYGYPAGQAAKVAVGTVAAFLHRSPAALEEVVFVLFDSKTFAAYVLALREMAEKW